MQKHFFRLFIFFFPIFFSACHGDSKESFIENFENFMTDVNSVAKNYTDEDWKIMDEQFADFNDKQFPKWENLMTPDEKEKVNEMIGKYRALQVKRGIKDLKNQIIDAFDQTKTIINELAKDSTITK